MIEELRTLPTERLIGLLGEIFSEGPWMTPGLFILCMSTNSGDEIFDSIVAVLRERLHAAATKKMGGLR